MTDALNKDEKSLINLVDFATAARSPVEVADKVLDAKLGEDYTELNEKANLFLAAYEEFRSEMLYATGDLAPRMVENGLDATKVNDLGIRL